MAKVTYKDAGVDLDVYRQSMARLPKLLGRTYSPRVLPLDGGFAGLFRLDFANRLFARNYEDPVLVSCSDGVGTKLKVACAVGNHKTVGIDLVAMSVNDALCCGAEPLFFLDYVAMPKDDPGFAGRPRARSERRLHPGRLRLLGGETAILPDLYAPGDYDLAGFCVGVASRSQIIDGSAVTPGDAVLGLASTGLHSNGYSLARKIAFDVGGHKVTDHVEELGHDGGRGIAHAHADLRPAGAAGVDALSREERGACHRPHHRRRAARESGPRDSAGRADRHRASAAGRCRRFSPGCSGWAASNRPRWTRSSTWASAWCWW